MGWLEFFGGIISLIIARWFYKELKVVKDVTDPTYMTNLSGVVIFAIFGIGLIFTAL